MIRKDEKKLKEWLREAKKLVDKYKTIDRVLYQLAFIATGDGPGKLEAIMKLRELVEMGIITEQQYKKIIADARRWRQIKYHEKLTRDIESAYEEVVGDENEY